MTRNPKTQHRTITSKALISVVIDMTRNAMKRLEDTLDYGTQCRIYKWGLCLNLYYYFVSFHFYLSSNVSYFYNYREYAYAVSSPIRRAIEMASSSIVRAIGFYVDRVTEGNNV